jgi:hypothetical protein
MSLYYYSLQDVGLSCEIPGDTVLQTYQLSLDKIIPYNLQKLQAIRIMVVFGVYDFLKVVEFKPGAHTAILVGRFKFRCMILANVAM